MLLIPVVFNLAYISKELKKIRELIERVEQTKNTGKD